MLKHHSLFNGGFGMMSMTSALLRKLYSSMRCHIHFLLLKRSYPQAVHGIFVWPIKSNSRHRGLSKIHYHGEVFLSTHCLWFRNDSLRYVHCSLKKGTSFFTMSPIISCETHTFSSCFQSLSSAVAVLPWPLRFPPRS